MARFHLGKRFIPTLIGVTLLYVVVMLIISPEDEGEQGRASNTSDMPYEDLAAAYEKLKSQLHKADSTHIIRRYHDRHALFSAEGVFDEKVMAATRKHFQSQLGREKIYLDLPEFDWQRDDEARPVDVLRLSFRGNGIPANVEQLAKSGLLAPQLHAYYSALIQQNTVLWTKPEASVRFAVKTSNGELYEAHSVPFIAVQRLSKDYFAKMQAASLPFLWEAYVDEDAQRATQRALLAEPHGPVDMVGPHLPDNWERPIKLVPYERQGPSVPRTQAEIIASHEVLTKAAEPHGPFAKASSENLLDALPAVAGAMLEQQEKTRKAPAVSSFNLDERQVEALFEESVMEDSGSLTETLEWKKAINNKRFDDAIAKGAGKHLDRLSRLDPEFMTLFLINNLFSQYNIFSVFDKDVHLTINALDTRLNVLYVSYNLRFDPIEPEDVEGEDIPPGCGDKPVSISDEFFLIAAKPYSYLVRVYLPRCELDNADLDDVDQFLSEMRILH